MSRYVVALDPPALAVGRTELSLNSGPIKVDGSKGIDWGDAEIKAFVAEQQFGEAPTDYRVPNRIITIPLLLGAEDLHTEAAAIAAQETAREHLRQKVGLFQRQGGVLKRERSNGEPVYADIVNAVLHIPDVYGERGVEPEVTLRLECLPDFYGEEVELDAAEETEQVIGVLKKSGSPAVIKGDYPGRCRIVLTDASGHLQRTVVWGFRSLYYTSAAEAALSYDAYTLTGVNGATSATEAEAISGKAMVLSTPQPNLFHPFLELKQAASAKHFNHVGSYRVLIRARAGAGAKFRLSWSIDEGTWPHVNDSQTISSEGSFEIIDLGEIRVEEPPVGEHFWNGVVQVETGATSTAVAVDRVWLQPLDDGGGRLRATAEPQVTTLSVATPPTSAESNNSLHAGAAWTNPLNVTVGHTGEYTHVSAISQALVLTHFGFAIPAGATVQQITAEAEIESFATSSSVLTVQFVKGGVLSGSSHGIHFPSGHGDYTQNMGSLTRAEVNEPTFGIALWLPKEVGGSEVRVYSVKLNIAYSFGTSGTSEDAVIYASKKVEIRTEGSFRESTTAGSFARVSEETGDLPRIPVSGMENREVQLFIKQSRELLPESGATETLTGSGDTIADKLKAQVFYRPCYLGRI